MLDVSQFSYEGLLNLARNTAVLMADRVSALNSLLSATQNFTGPAFLRKALNDDADLDKVFLAAGAARPPLTSSVAAPADPGNDSTFVRQIGIQGMLQIAKDRSAVTAQRLAAIDELLNNLGLISPAEFPNLNTAAAGAGRGLDNAEISAQLTLLRNQIQAGTA